MAINLGADWVEVFGTNCMQNGTALSCEDSPYNTTNYFNETGLISLGTYDDEISDGFVVTGNIYDQQICVNALYGDANLEYFCSIES